MSGYTIARLARGTDGNIWKLKQSTQDPDYGWWERVYYETLPVLDVENMELEGGESCLRR